MIYIKEFCEFLESINLKAADESQILADDKRRYYQIYGDKAGIKKGSYCLKIDGDMGIGWVFDHRTGVTTPYTSKNKNKLSPEEKKAWKEKIELSRKKQEAELEQSRLEAAKEAQSIWMAAKTEGNHAYLERKKIGLNGARINGDKLLIPVRIDNKITSIQTIYPNGDKIFLSGGEIKGGYFSLAQHDDDLSEIVISEGFATACTLREVLKKPVVCCFNAGNIKASAQAVKVKFPNCKLIICADNDAGKKINTGITKALQAAAAVGNTHVVYPMFNEGETGTDANDLYILRGADAVLDMFKTVDNIPHHEPIPVEILETSSDMPPEWFDEIPPIEAYNEEALQQVELYKDKAMNNGDWMSRLAMDDKGKVLKTMNNTLLFMEHDPKLGNLFCYDEFCHQKIVYRCPPWENPASFSVRTLTDEDKTHLTVQLEKRGVVQPFTTVERLLDAIIRRNTRNPAIEYFNSLVWDGIKRLDRWLINYCGCTYDDERYVSAIGKKWLTASVYRVFNAGYKFDHMLILEGKQRIGKSYILQELATIRGKSFFIDNIKINKISERDTIEKMQGKLIIEFAELTGMNKTDDSELKQVITMQTDSLVKKYRNEVTEYPRQFIMAGTYNPNGTGIFTDTTGNERFWIVKVGDKLDIEGIKRDKEQLWAEAVVAYKNGEKLFLDSEITELARAAQAERLVEHPWEHDIRPLCFDKNKVFASDIWEKLQLFDRIKRRQASAEISKIMTQLGFIRTKSRNGGEPEPAWVRSNPIETNEWEF